MLVSRKKMLLFTLHFAFSFSLFIMSTYVITESSGDSIFSVIPATRQDWHSRVACNTSDKDACTVDEYYEMNNNIFSTPNSTWIFQKGSHKSSNGINIINTSNVFLGCPSEKCKIRTDKDIKLENSKNITLQGFHFIDVSTRFSRFPNISITRVQELNLTHLVITGFIFTISHPIGCYEIENCTFDNCDLNVNFDSQDLQAEFASEIVSIKFCKIKFQGSSFQEYFSDTSGYSEAQSTGSITTIEESDFINSYILITNDTKLYNINKYDFQRPAILFINCRFEIIDVSHTKELMVFHNALGVVLSNCTVNGSLSGSIRLFNSNLLTRGNIIIKGNDNTWTTGLGYINLFNSRIFLQNTSTLKIIENKSFLGSILFLPINLFSYHENIYYDYTQCAAGRMEQCDRSCFFQAIDQNGVLLRERDIPFFNGTIIMDNNTVEYGGNQIYNGQLEDCTLYTQEGHMTINKTILEQFIHLPSFTPKDVSSLPYYICLCEEARVGKRDKQNCGNVSNLDLYQGETLHIIVALVGDFDQNIGDTKISVGIGEDSERKPVEQHCTEVYSTGPVSISPEKMIINLKYTVIELSIGEMDLSLTHVVNVNILPCPIGFKPKDNRNASSTCICNDILNEFDFQCNIQQNEVIFKHANPKIYTYWLGIEGNHTLKFGKFCPPYFCNNILQDSNVSYNSLQNTPNKQCNSNTKREGFLCSECPEGYSSVLGGYECKQCQENWHFLIVIYTLSGPVLIMFLFLFNLTIVQGSINSFIFYTNIVYFYDDFLQEHTVQPFYNIYSISNIGSGKGLCFFIGMNEFHKVWLQFIYPLYLLLLVVFIIIGANKFNLRIFQVDFITQRAVPVLATLMILTYTNFITCIWKAFRFTRVVEIDGQGNSLHEHYLWLLQPTLPYLQGTHLILGMFALAITLIYILPLTLVTLFGEIIRRRCIRSMWFSHFLDTFHGCYRWPFGFWLGVRLFIRVLLIIPRNLWPQNIFAIFTLYFITFFFLIQIILKPFQTEIKWLQSQQGQKQTSLNGKQITSKWKSKIKALLKWLITPLVFDSISLLNILFLSSIVAINPNISFSKFASCFSISIFFLQGIYGSVHHAYLYFPIPKWIKWKWEQLKQRLPGRQTEDENLMGEGDDSLLNFQYREMQNAEFDLSTNHEEVTTNDIEAVSQEVQLQEDPSLPLLETQI